MIRGLISAFKKKDDIICESNNDYDVKELHIQSKLNIDDIDVQLDNSRIDNLIRFYHNGCKKAYPEHFVKDEYFDSAQKVYQKIGINENLKEIRLVCGLDGAGQTETEENSVNGILSIIISVSAYKVGIGSGLGINDFTLERCNEFCDVLAHELFHAQSISNIIIEHGMGEYKKIKSETDLYTKLAFMMVEEYYACRKNGELFGSLESVETLEKAEKVVRFKMGQFKRELLYSLATVIAFSEVSDEYKNNLQIEHSNLKEIFYVLKEFLDKAYKNAPLNFDMYKTFGNSLKTIIEPLF